LFFFNFVCFVSVFLLFKLIRTFAELSYDEDSCYGLIELVNLFANEKLRAHEIDRESSELKNKIYLKKTAKFNQEKFISLDKLQVRKR